MPAQKIAEKGVVVHGVREGRNEQREGRKEEGWAGRAGGRWVMSSYVEGRFCCAFCGIREADQP